MGRHAILLVTIVLLCGCATIPRSGPDYVVIDRKEAAYTVFVGIPDKRLDAVKTKLSGDHGVDLVAWEAFNQGKDTYISARILKDEYPGSGAVAGIIELVRKFPENPIGLTWNGGVAITLRDYQHAKRTYQQYQANSADYERTRIRDPRADPVNPRTHLDPLLGR